MNILKIGLVLVSLCAFSASAIRLTDEQPSKVETILAQLDSVVPASLQIPTEKNLSR